MDGRQGVLWFAKDSQKFTNIYSSDYTLLKSGTKDLYQNQLTELEAGRDAQNEHRCLI